VKLVEVSEDHAQCRVLVLAIECGGFESDTSYLDHKQEEHPVF
jgi:hypothetical protein